MEKLAYVFTNGLYAELVVLFNKNVEEECTEVLNERVLNEVLLPNEWDKFYFTKEECEKNEEEKDEDGYYIYMTNVYSNDSKEYFFDSENLIIKNATKEDVKNWEELYWCTIIELD